MLELITGTPGACKTATAVADVCVKVPGSFLEADKRCTSHGKVYEKGEAVPRHLFSNIKGLLVDHTPIDDESMRTWHLWAQPGDVIVFDEAQSLWRPRAVGSKVPEEIQALETHRHMGVDIVVVTQHPMLIDSNVRRLVNRHRHLRRIPGGWVMAYEWDHCGQPGSYKSCVRSPLQRIPRAAFPLYESAQLHTKPTLQLPKVLLLALVAGVGVVAYMVPDVYARIAGRAEAAKGAAVAKQSVQDRAAGGAGSASAAAAAASAPVAAVPALGAASGLAAPAIAGCVAVGAECRCFDGSGGRVYLLPELCGERLPQGGPVRLVKHALELPQASAAVAVEVDGDVWKSMRR